jgi:hypothetical protein
MSKQGNKSELDCINAIIHFAGILAYQKTDAEVIAFIKKAFADNLGELALIRNAKAEAKYIQRQKKMSSISKAIYGGFK